MAYGYGTRSHLRSTEHRQMQQERRRATEEFENRTERQVIDVPLLCTCLSFRYPHPPHGWEGMPDWRRRYS